MTDTISAARRSANMRAIRSRDMQPELLVRRLAYAMGYRFRLHYGNLPGKPDLAFPARRKAIFVHGCFWHCHACTNGHTPKSNRRYWVPKLRRNRERDRKNLKALAAAGWKGLVIWECETQDREAVSDRLAAFLGA